MSNFSDNFRARGSALSSFARPRRRIDDAEVIVLSGELDLATAPELRERLTSAVESSTTSAIALDLSDVTFIDARCVGVIMHVSDTAARRGRRLRVVGLHGTPKLVFDVLGLGSMASGRGSVG